MQRSSGCEECQRLQKQLPCDDCGRRLKRMKEPRANCAMCTRCTRCTSAAAERHPDWGVEARHWQPHPRWQHANTRDRRLQEAQRAWKQVGSSQQQQQQLSLCVSLSLCLSLCLSFSLSLFLSLARTLSVAAIMCMGGGTRPCLICGISAA
jgi:hypothetical protein